MKILLTGSRGQLGLEVTKQLSEAGKYTVIETDVHNLDITDDKQVLELVQSERPDIIINCAAYTNVDKCESSEEVAFKVNATAAGFLSSAAYSIGAEIMHISTDYVFDGNGSVPKREYHEINPQSVYGKSKALGEKLVMTSNPRYYILRTAWLYGNGNNFARTMLNLAKEKDEINVVSDQIGTPTSTVDLAKCMINLISSKYYGVYHSTCEGSCSWYHFAKEIFKLKGLDVKVNEITSEQIERPAKRPKYSVLDNFMLKIINKNTFRSWEEALKEYMLNSNVN